MRIESIKTIVLISSCVISQVASANQANGGHPSHKLLVCKVRAENVTTNRTTCGLNENVEKHDCDAESSPQFFFRLNVTFREKHFTYR